jgi:hypothetical protein
MKTANRDQRFASGPTSDGLLDRHDFMTECGLGYRLGRGREYDKRRPCAPEPDRCTKRMEPLEPSGSGGSIYAGRSSTRVTPSSYVATQIEPGAIAKSMGFRCCPSSTDASICPASGS